MANPNQTNPEKGNEKPNRTGDPAGGQRQQDQQTGRDQKPQQGGAGGQDQQRRDQERGEKQR